MGLFDPAEAMTALSKDWCWPQSARPWSCHQSWSPDRTLQTKIPSWVGPSWYKQPLWHLLPISTLHSTYLHFRIGCRIEFVLGLLSIQITLEISKRYLVSGLVLSILLTLLLHSIICQMDHLVGQVLEVELLACCPDVALLKPVAFRNAIEGSYADVCSYVKFPLIVQKRHDVFLEDVCPWSTHRVCLLWLNQFCNFL